jgi:hypothetical protein
MKPNKTLNFSKLTISLLIMSLGISATSFAGLECKRYPTAGLSLVHTPQKNSIERKAILEALRKDIFSRFQIQTIFVISFFKANLNYAYIQAEPKSQDGKNSYEPVSALLKREGSCWQVAGYVSLVDPDEEFEVALNRLRDEFPDAPDDIFE